MKKIFLWGYWAKNFGDDLFLKVYLDRFKEMGLQTYLLTSKKYKRFYNEMGFNVITNDSLIYRLICKVLSHLRKPELYYLLVNKESLFVLLGGSLFAENKGKDAEQKQVQNLNCAIKKAEKSFVIGSNFGPYIHKEFKETYRMLFGKMEDVAFRDKTSYELFKSTNKNVRYAPDIAFEGNWETKIDDSNYSNYVAISVINTEYRPELSKYREIYEKGIVDICLYHIQRNEKIYLLSLCEQEGDLKTCERIYRAFKQVDKKNVKVISYSSIDEIISILANSKKNYATRFHALMISLYFRKSVIPIIYNEKGINALSTYCDSLKWFDIKDFDERNLHAMMSMDQTGVLELSDAKQFQGLMKYIRNRRCDDGI